MASITVDIEARVVGYQNSLKQLQTAFAKVDPGSEIGKKLSAAIASAQKQINDLSKNMFPKASSDSQIDAIAEKVNRVGASLQDAAGLFQNLKIDDLNLGNLGSEVTSIIDKMESLQSTINTTLNTGMQEAVSNSSLLSQAFAELGVNVKTMTADSGKLALTQGLEETVEAANKATEALENAKLKVANIQSEMTALKAGDGGKFLQEGFNLDDILGQFSAFKNPEKILDMSQLATLKQHILDGLANTKIEDKSVAQTLVDNIFGSFDPSTSLETFKTKFNELRTSLIQLGMSNGEFQRAAQTQGDGTKLFRSMLGIDDASVAETQTRLRTLVESFQSSFTSTASYKATLKLIDDKSFEAAANRAMVAIQNHFDKIINAYKNKESELNAAMQNQTAADEAAKAASEKSERLTNATREYDLSQTNIEQTLASQRAEIESLRQELNTLKTEVLGKVQQGAAGAGSGARQQTFPLNEAQAYSKELTKINSAQQFVGKLQGITQRWFSVYAAVRMVSSAIKKIIANTKELDATITEIAIVTNMDQTQLWGQMPKYIEMAKSYGASIAGAYKVSQLYYQQGLGQEDVMALSEQTLKMARISGLDYAQATDYMTNAVRSFKMEMQDASTVVDTYSAVAAASATSVTELATAMSKTASSAQSVGSSLQNTTAMMAVMIEATRESPENIGSAMKSIISRYGELKENKTGIDEEGEEYSLNKVDTALQAVGISIHDAKGEFRDFDDVIFELADHWDEIDKNTQRYIATVMAGNRQQSRFLALVSSGERLKELSETAADSEDASQMQYLKTLDSIEYKTQQLQTSLQSLYANEGVQNLIKDTLDSITNIIDSFNNMSSAFNTPIAAIAKFGVQFANIARIVTTTFGLIKTGVAAQIDAIRSHGIAKAQQAANQEVQIEQEKNQKILQSAVMTDTYKYNRAQGMSPADAKVATLGLWGVGGNEAIEPANLTLGQKIKGYFGNGKGKALAGLGASILGSVLTMGAMQMSENTQDERNAKALQNGIGSFFTGIGMGSAFGIPGMIVGGLIGGISGIIEGQKIRNESAEERAARLKKETEEAKNENIAKKNEFKSLKSTIDEYEKLKQNHLESAEAAEKYQEVCNKIAEEHPDLVSSYDSEGNAVLNLAAAYEKLNAVKAEENKTTGERIDAEIAEAKNIEQQSHIVASQAVANENLATALSNDKTGKTAEEWRSDFEIFTQNSIGMGTTYAPHEYAMQVGDQSMQSLLDGLASHTYTIEGLAEYLGQYSDLLNNDTIRKSLLAQDQAGLFEQLYFAYDAFSKRQSQTSDASSEVAKTRAQEERDATRTRSTVAAGAQTMAQGYVQSRLLEDELYGTNKYANLSQFKNANVLAGRYIDEQYKISDNQDHFFAQEAEGAFDVFEAALSKFWTSSSQSAKDTLTNITTNQGRYTKEELSNILTGPDSLFGDNISNPIVQSIMAYYTDILPSPNDFVELTSSMRGKRDKTGIGQIFTENLKTIEDYKNELLAEGFSGTEEQLEAAAQQSSQIMQAQHWMSKLGPTEQQAVSSFYNALLDSINNDTISAETGAQIAHTYVDTWKNLTSSDFIDQYGTKTADEAQKILSEADFTNQDDLNNFIQQLTDLGIDISALGLDFDITLPPNFSAHIQTFGEQVTTQMTNFEKDISSVTKGMDLAGASKMADQLGISLTQFRQEGNKFFLDDYNLLEDYYFKDREKALADLQAEQTKELTGTKNALELTQLQQLFDEQGDWQEELNNLFSDESFIKQLQSKKINVNPNLLKNQLQKYKQDLDDGKTTENFLTYLENNFKDTYDAFVTASGEALEYNIASAQISRGDIQGFIETTRGIKSEDFNQYYQEALKQTNDANIAQYIAESQVQSAQSWNAENEKLIARISTGDTENLPQELQKYAKLIYNSFNAVKSSVMSSVFDAMGGGEQSLFVTAENQDFVSKMQEQGWVEGTVEVDKQVQLKIDEMLDDEDKFTQWVKENATSRKQRAEWLKQFHSIKYPDASEIASKMTSGAALDRLDFDTVQDLYALVGQGYDTEEAFAEAFGLQLDSYGAIYKDYDLYIQKIQEQIKKELNPTKKRELEADLASAQRTRKTKTLTDTKKAIQDLLKDTDQISEETRTAFEKAIGKEEAAKYFKDNLDGTHTLDVAQLRKDIENETLDVSEAQEQLLTESFAQLGDEAIGAVEGAIKLITSGTTKQEDMQKVINAFKGRYTQDELFNYDEIIDAYTFNPQYLQEYQAIQAQKYAEAMGVSYEDAFARISQETEETLQNQVKIEDFLKADNYQGKIRQTLSNSMKQVRYATANWQSEILTDYLLQDTSELNVQSMRQAQTSVAIAREHNKNLRQTIDKQVENDIKALEAGGQAAIDVLQFYTSGRELSTEEIEAAYRNKVNDLQAVSEVLGDITVNSVVSQNIARELSQIDGFEVNDDGVVTAVGNMVTAYQAIYDQMIYTAGRTTADLNAAYANLLTAQEQGDIDAIEAMGSAMGMTYSALGEILAKQGLSMEKWMNEYADQGIYEKIGAGKIRITDFTRFAAQMGWEPGSEEYTSAFKTYNDALIELNNKVQKDITNELKSLETASRGDKLNMTQLYTSFMNAWGRAVDLNKQQKRILTKLNTYDSQPTDDEITQLSDRRAELLRDHESQVVKYEQALADLQAAGGDFTDGILTLTEDANLYAVTLALEDIAELSVNELGDYFYEIQDIIQSIISEYTNSIKNSIKGSLNYSDRDKFIEQADDLGVNLQESDFTRTTEGFKLSNKQANKLYQKLKQIDRVQAQLVFEDLKTSLEETNDDFKTTTSLLSHIGELQNELTSAMEMKVDPSAIEDLQDELTLALEINLVNLNTDEADWNFMNQDWLPAGAKNGIEYFTGISEASSLLSTATEEGQISVSKFATLMHHVEEVALGTGQTVDFLGQKLGKDGTVTWDNIMDTLMSKYYIDPKSKEAMIDTATLMTELGFDFSQAASSFEGSFKTAVETYVLMNQKQLKDVGDFYLTVGQFRDAINNAQHFDFNTLFDDTGFDLARLKQVAEYTDDSGKEANNILENLYKAADNFTVNGKNLGNELRRNEEIIRQDTAEYRAIQSILEVSAIDDWTDPDAYALISSRFADAGYEGSIKVGEDVTITVEGGEVILETVKNGEKQVHYNGKEYSDSEVALTALRQDQSKAIEQQIADAQTNGEIRQGEYTILLKDGLKFTVTHDENGVAMVDDKTTLAQAVKNAYSKYKADNKDNVAGYLSEEAWQIDQELKFIPTIDQQGGTLTSDQRETLVSAGLTNVEALDALLKDEVKRKNLEATIGMKLDIDDSGNMTEEAKAKLLDAINNGSLVQSITDAISSDAAKTAIGSAISEGLTSSLVSETGVLDIPVPEVKVTAEKITVDLSKAKPSADGEIPEIDSKSAVQAGAAAAGAYNAVGESADGASTKVDNLNNNLLTLSNGIEIDVSGIQALANILEKAASAGERLSSIDWATVGTAVAGFNESVRSSAATQTEASTKNATSDAITTPPIETTQILTVQVEDKEAQDKINKLIASAAKALMTIQGDPGPAEAAIRQVQSTAASSPAQQSIEVDSNQVPATVDSNVTYAKEHPAKQDVKTSSGDDSGDGGSGANNATGNFGLAKAAGTLMGELGPELVVQNGRYFVAGQNGAEFVDLASDAIVFNHLQTERLFKNGMSPDRGRAVTNERVASSFAHGNLNGGIALSGLTQQGNANLNIASAMTNAGKNSQFSSAAWHPGTNLRQKDEKAEEEIKQTADNTEEEVNLMEGLIKEVERWYNYLQDIAKYEKQIAEQSAYRSRLESDFIRDGRDYFASQMSSINTITNKINTNTDLLTARQEFYTQRSQELLSGTPLGKWYTTDKDGQVKYANDSVFEELKQLFTANDFGVPNTLIPDLYSKLVAQGWGEYMKFDTNGKEIDTSKDGWEKSAVEAVWELSQKQIGELQKEWDAMQEIKETLQNDTAERNEILHDMEDNQINVENQVLETLIDIREREIEDAEEEKKAIQEASQNMIDGLSEQLQKEREMYEHQQSANELGKLQRQLSILQRSGGSGSQIATLQSQINDKTQQLYFDTQQQQIDELQEAVDTQIQRLEDQIDLMKEQLEYEKDHGLLWDQVREIMKGDSTQIANFIMSNSKYWSNAPDAFAKQQRDVLFDVERWSPLASVEGGLDALVNEFCSKAEAPDIEEREEEEESTNTESTEATTAEDDLARREREARERQQHGRSEEEIERIRNDAIAEDMRKGEYKARLIQFGGQAAANILGGISHLDVTGLQTAAVENNLMSKGTKNPLVKTITGKYDIGGMVDEDQFALVHAKEAVLTPEQTKMFREDLLGQSSNSALRQLQALRDEWSQQVHDVENTLSTFASLYHQDENGLSYNSASSGFSVWIENAAVNMNVEKLADDYDAQRAGEQALERMLQIARKTSGWNRIGG